MIDAVGIAPLTEQAVDLTCPTGRVAVIGFDAKPAQIPPVKITKKELTFSGFTHELSSVPQSSGVAE